MDIRTRVLCVDDSRDITDVLRRVIDAALGMECVGCFESADSLSEEVQRLRADVVLLDATMPGRDPIDAMRELSTEYPEVKTIVFSGYDSPDFIDRTIDAGAWGCVSKHDDLESVVRAVHEVARGRTVFPGRGGPATQATLWPR